MSRRGRDFDPRAYVEPRPRPGLIRLLGLLNRHVVLPRLLKIRAVELPRPDFERLRATVRPGTAAFLGPAHPEFMTDWMLDKEISRRISPLMAHWASWEIVNASPLAQRFWLANNLIANAPGGAGREYSVAWGLAGHGVLLHPEGGASGQAARVGPLVPGIVEMAWEACRRARERGTDVPVWVVPLVWRLHFVRDEGRALSRAIGWIERRLALPAGAGLPVERRFAALQWNLMRARAAALEVPLPAGGAEDYFAVQRAALAGYRRELERHGGSGDAPERAIHVWRRAIHREARADPALARRERERVGEFERLLRFSADLYGGSTLAQEAIAETLQRTRLALPARGWRDALYHAVPVAVGARIARVRAPEPLAVHEAFTANEPAATRCREALLAELRARLQGALDALGEEIAPAIERWRRPNPLATAAGTAA